MRATKVRNLWKAMIWSEEEKDYMGKYLISPIPLSFSSLSNFLFCVYACVCVSLYVCLYVCLCVYMCVPLYMYVCFYVCVCDSLFWKHHDWRRKNARNILQMTPDLWKLNETAILVTWYPRLFVMSAEQYRGKSWCFPISQWLIGLYSKGLDFFHLIFNFFLSALIIEFKNGWKEITDSYSDTPVSRGICLWAIVI